MSMLIVAAAVFLAIHLLVAGTRARDGLVSALGENAYLGLFSLVSAGVIVWMVVAYNAAQASGNSRVLYDLGRGVRDLGIPILAIAFLLAVPGLLTPNPTTVRQEHAAQKAGAVRGVLRITRHPFLWGVAIWAAFHVAVNGDQASVFFFGTFLVLALLGTVSIDAKRRRKLGVGWTDFASKTSNVPFGAILSGRTSFSAKEYFDWRFLLALIVFIALLFAHAALFGVSAFPGGWVP
jgi:uncharacterized membrane protein